MRGVWLQLLSQDRPRAPHHQRSPEAEAGVSSMWQAVFRPEAAHQAGARGTQARVPDLQEEVHQPDSAHQQDPQAAAGGAVRQVRQDILPRESAEATPGGCPQLLTTRPSIVGSVCPT